MRPGGAGFQSGKARVALTRRGGIEADEGGQVTDVCTPLVSVCQSAAYEIPRARFCLNLQVIGSVLGRLYTERRTRSTVT
jgi:hypothetical protein